MATAILANFGDPDTLVLPNIWADMDINEADIHSNVEGSSVIVNKMIADEKDLIIFAGHGASTGMFNPSYSYDSFMLSTMSSPYLISKQNLNLLNAKKVVGIWCHASDFAKANNLKGFYSSMFISNPGEASFEGIPNAKADDITAMEVKFCKDLNELIKSDIPMKDWKDILISKADMSDLVTKFNYNGLTYLE